MNVITLGTFDLFHWGHVNLLKKCREIARDDVVTVAINTDGFITKYKGKPPIMTFQERIRMVESLDLADICIPNDQPDGTARGVIKDSKAKLIVVGSDWGRKDYLHQIGVNWDWLDRQNIGVAFVTYTPGISTTNIKARL